MSLRDWFASRRTKRLVPPEEGPPRPELADGLWTKCEKCKAVLYTQEWADNLFVCPKCHYHHRLRARERLRTLLDPDSFRETEGGMVSVDPLRFVDLRPYPDRLQEARSKSGEREAVVTGTGHLGGVDVAIGVMDFFFMGGSMGSVVGEKLTRLIERAGRDRLPLILVAASGGARMQEGTLSLMQMAKTGAALNRFSRRGGLYLSVLTDPTTGGVTASFAMLGDLIVAEPRALIGFTGRRVIEQTIRQKLPEDFQTAEYLLSHGLIDLIVPRSQLRSTLGRLLAMHGYIPARPEDQHLLCPV